MNRKVLITFTFSILVLPVAAFADIVPCGGGTDPCNACHLLQMGGNILKFLIGIGWAIAAIGFAVAGFKLVTSAGNEGQVTAAKGLFSNVLIGFIILLASWLIVDTVLQILTERGGIGSWQGFVCEGAGETGGVSPGIPLPPQEEIPPGEELPGEGDECHLCDTYAGYEFNTAIVEKVQYIDENFALTVSGGYRTEERNEEVGGSENSHHLTGSAADFVGSESAMEAGADWARNNGAIEVLIHDAGSGDHLHVAW